MALKKNKHTIQKLQFITFHPKSFTLVLKFIFQKLNKENKAFIIIGDRLWFIKVVIILFDIFENVSAVMWSSMVKLGVFFFNVTKVSRITLPKLNSFLCSFF